MFILVGIPSPLMEAPFTQDKGLAGMIPFDDQELAGLRPQRVHQLILPKIPPIGWKAGDALVWVIDFEIAPGLLLGLVSLQRDPSNIPSP